MKKLYYDIPYVKSFQALVLGCQPGMGGRYHVALDQTGFYPEGGGQPSDTGLLGDAHVLHVQEKDGQVIHQVDRPLKPGSQVEGRLDWESRYDNMQQHSGEHILSGLVHRRHGYDNVGFHMGKDQVTVDFNGLLTMEQLAEIEDQANSLVYENLPILETYPGPEALEKLDYRSKKELTGQVRIIQIPGGDVCACCGTHVMRTGEIGLIKVTGMIRYKGGVRVSLLCGRRALQDYGRKLGQVTAISATLSAKPDLVAEAVERLKAECGSKEFLANQLYLQLFQEKAQTYPCQEGGLAVFEDGLGPVQLRQFCTLLYQGGKGGVVLACSGKEGNYHYALGSTKEDMGAASRAMNQMLGGRGGGSQLLAQGTFLAGKDQIMEAFQQLWAEAGPGRKGDEHGIQ